MWGGNRADGGLPPWSSVKERAKSSLCPRQVLWTKTSERDLVSFTDLDLTLYARTELSEKRRGEGGTSLPDRVEATTGVVMYMAKLAAGDNSRVGREALRRVDMQWGHSSNLWGERYITST